jgi:transcription initiation factor TFIIH subunit 1
MNKELEEKNRMLSDNPGLLQLYKDLVITNIITPEEFWRQHAPKNDGSANAQNQDVGVAGSFMGEIKPQADGANGIRYKIML